MSLGIQIGASHETFRGLGDGADAREGRRSSSLRWNHRLWLQPRCCPLLGSPSAPREHPQVSSHHAVCTPTTSQPRRQVTHFGQTGIQSPTSKSTGFLVQLLRPNYRLQSCLKKKRRKKKKGKKQSPKSEM